MTPSPAFGVLDDFDRLCDVLAAADYSDGGVAEALQVAEARAVSGRDRSLLLRRTSEPTPRNTLIRLLLIGVHVDADAARAAVAPMTLDEWCQAGLLSRQGDAVLGAIQLLPFQGFLLACDRPQEIQSGLREDYVMGIGSSTLTLANLTVRRPVRSALDLGTGCGLLAFLAARHAERVAAVDRNPRAVQVARFNARLNGLPNVECLEGDLFEPVAGRQFDLVVSNPPFVISPESRYIYRDSGMKGDEVTRRIVREVPAVLRDAADGSGGYCQILCNWAHLAGQPWQDRLARWFENTGCDAWVMRTDTLDAPAYAAKWIRHTERDDEETFERRLAEWTAYYEREKIEAVSGGLITMRRRSGGPNWYRADDGPEKMLGPAGDDLALSFELRDFLEAHRDDDAMLSQRLRVPPNVRLQQAFEPSPSGWAVVESHLERQSGLSYSGNVDPYVAGLMAQCNGERPLKDLLEAMAASLRKQPGEIAPALLEIIRRLVERGFLAPADL
jgi:SAM-dependent methyltransferase